MNIYTVYLRQPAGLHDRRCDPFWEFGSFGSTGCHSSNLLHPRRSPLTAGDRLVFLQGSRGEVRAIAMTPPIHVGGQSSRLEALWDLKYRPLPYAQAALFIDNAGRTDFPSLLPMLDGVRRNTPCSAVGSKFRSRCRPVDPALAAEIAVWFDKSHSQVSNYFDAICHSDDPWREYAMRSGWSDPEVRAQRYKEFGGNLTGETVSDLYAELPSKCVTTCIRSDRSSLVLSPNLQPPVEPSKPRRRCS